MSRRPLRDRLEKRVREIPTGPLGLGGRGNVAGASGFAAGEILGIAVPGDSLDPGVELISRDVDRSGDNIVNIFEIAAFAEPPAVFAAKVFSLPSNIDRVIRDVEIVDVEPVHETRTTTTYRIVTRVENRGDV